VKLQNFNNLELLENGFKDFRTKENVFNDFMHLNMRKKTKMQSEGNMEEIAVET
jgi:hypothetical protein